MTEHAGERALKRRLGLRDLVLTQILCVVGSTWVGVAAGLGPGETVTWIAAMLVFYIPMAASVIALNREMPLEGGLYIWAHRAFGDLGGFLTAWNLWVYSVVLVAAILYGLPTELSYMIGPSAAHLPENRGASLLIVAIVLLAGTAATLRGLELGKWIHNAGGIAMLAVFVALILLPLWAIARGETIHWSPLAVRMPPHDLRAFALFGQMIFGALCGLEYIAILAGESEEPARTIGRSVWISSPIICAMFILGTGSIVALVPIDRIDYIAPIPQALRRTLGNAGLGSILAASAIVLVEMRLLGVASYIFTGLTRLPMATGWDALTPAWFTRLHPRWRTPWNSILFAAALVLLLVVLGGAGVHAQEGYQVLANASITHYELAYLAMFAIPLAGARQLRAALPTWVKITSVVGLLATLFSLLISAYPFVSVVNPRAYALKIAGATLLSNIAAGIFYRVRTRKVSLAAARAAELEDGQASG